MLTFSRANVKTKLLRLLPELQKYLQNGRRVYSLDLLSGWSCPGALHCLSRVIEDNKNNREIKDGRFCRFRCFSASQEVLYPNTYSLRKRNFTTLRETRGVSQCHSLLSKWLPPDCGILRLHVAGDFYKLSYLQAVLQLANEHQDVLFYSYTKALPFFQQIPIHNPSLGIINKTGNFLVTASYGGKYDDMITSLGLRSAKVVFTENEARPLPLDHNDNHAATPGGDFALLLHGMQPAKSPASRAWQTLKQNGMGGYKRR